VIGIGSWKKLEEEKEEESVGQRVLKLRKLLRY
jgi:hypothetical protein